MNLYLTTESEKKLRSLFINIKSFFIFDVLSFIQELHLDLSKPSSIYFVNDEIMKTIKRNSSLKKYLGIIYINKKLDDNLIKSLEHKLKKIQDINKLVLIDNGIIPKHKNLHSLFEEVFFYERFYKNKIVECQGISKDDSGVSLIMEENN